MKKVMLCETEYSDGLAATYENAARKAGYPVTERTQYDCRHICVADNIQERWIEYYKARIREKHPGMVENDVIQNVMALLLFMGAKADHALMPGEVRIEKGFIPDAESSEQTGTSCGVPTENTGGKKHERI